MQLQLHMGALQQQQERIKANNTIDDSVTAMKNDGNMYNAQGQPVLDNNGQAMRVGNSTGTLLTKEPITLATGEKAFIYANPDGTNRVEKIQGTAPNKVNIPQETIAKYAQMISSGMIKPDDLIKMGVPVEAVNQIIASVNPQSQKIPEKTQDLGDSIQVWYKDGTTEQITKGSERMSQYQQAQLAQKDRENTTMTPYQKAQIEIDKQKLGQGDWQESKNTP